MNKKLLLLALPAFMVLSSCGAHPVEQPEERPEAAMSETTVAQEEDARELVRTNTTYRVALTSDYVKVGYQIQFNANGEGDADDTISIRFVAALKGEVTSAYWHRGLAQPNSYEGADVGGGNWKYKFNDGTPHNSTVYYTALNNGGVRVAAGEGDFVGYDRFAIYTLMNIPYETYKDSYLAAYVELTGENTIKSQGLAVKIERNGSASKNRFYFDPNTTGHFLEGTIEGNLRDGSDNEHTLLRGTEYGEGDNSAEFADLELLTTDSFGSFYYAVGTTFQFFGYDSFVEDTAFVFFEASSLSGYSKPVFADTISVFVSRNDQNKLYGSTDTTVSVSFATNYGTNYGDSVFIAVNNDGWNANTKYVLTWSDGNNWSGTFSIAIGSYVKYVIGPSSGGSATRWESGAVHYITHETTSISCQGWE